MEYQSNWGEFNKTQSWNGENNENMKACDMMYKIKPKITTLYEYDHSKCESVFLSAELKIVINVKLNEFLVGLKLNWNFSLGIWIKIPLNWIPEKFKRTVYNFIDWKIKENEPC